MPTQDLDQLADALTKNRRSWKDASVQSAIKQLKANRNFSALAELTEKCARYQPNDPMLRRLQAQALIETGQPATAISVIEGILARIAADHREVPELQGLLGRAYKQILVDSGGDQDAAHRALLKKATAAYSDAYRVDTSSYWHGGNLLALGWRAERQGVSKSNPGQLMTLARRVMAAARAAAVNSGDPWAYATMAEASVALRDPAATEAALRDFLNAEGLDAFQVGSLLRQLVQVWQLEGNEWAGALAALRARHTRLPGADATLLGAGDVQYLLANEPEMKLVYERILGPASGLVPYAWWQLANLRATGVAAVRDEQNRTIGTAFVIDGGSLLDQWAGSTLALTNFHVINRDGVEKGLRPESAELVFEAVDPTRRHTVSKLLWESPPRDFDCAVLQLDPPPPAAGAAPLARRLPLRDAQPASRIYIIGHPAGRGLEFSIQDNDLLDHDEGLSSITRLHYRASTEGGSSGSPVFKEGQWEAIAIHHAYTESKLNGKAGTYQANEGIGLQSLRAALQVTA